MSEIEKAVRAIPSGTYVVAVSGGVDSMVLLDALRQRSDVQLIVAHFDHGIRKESQQDRTFVQTVCMSHNIKIEYEEGKLGANASEAKAREARYAFLRKIRKKYQASAIMTAHHQDDALETTIINLVRGTGRRGITTLYAKNIVRPFLHVSKSEIVAYAKRNKVPWREDHTNADWRYLRNYVRHVILPLASGRDAEFRQNMLRVMSRQHMINQAIEEECSRIVAQYVVFGHDYASIRRYPLVMAPKAVALELLQYTLHHLTTKTLERPQAELALLFIRAGKPGKLHQLNKQWQLRSGPKEVIVEPR